MNAQGIVSFTSLFLARRTPGRTPAITGRYRAPRPFDFISVFLAGTDLRGDPNETVRGYRNGVEVYTVAVALDPSLAMQQYSFNFVGVDSVRFDGRNGYGNLLVDDIAYRETGAVAPEPGTIVLLSTGFLCLCAARRRIRFGRASS